MKKIVTHPDNLKYVQELFKDEIEKERREQEKDSCLGFIHFMNPFGMKIVSNPNMEKEKWTGRWLVKQTEFYSYWDGKGEPSSWAIYFGFVVKEMTPLFYDMNDRITVFDPCWKTFGVKNDKSFLLSSAGV